MENKKPLNQNKMRDINSIVVINVALVNTEDTFLLNVLELAEELLRFKSE